MVDHFNHFIHVLVGLRQFLQDSVSGLASHQNAARFEFALLLAGILAPANGSAAHQAAGPVAHAAEGLFHRTLPAGKDPRRRAHAAWDEYRLPDTAILRRHFAVSGRKSTGGALSMHEHFALLSSHVIAFKFGDVVAHVVDQIQPRPFAEHAPERSA